MGVCTYNIGCKVILLSTVSSEGKNKRKQAETHIPVLVITDGEYLKDAQFSKRL